MWLLWPQPPALSLTRVSHGINHNGFGPGAPAALVPRPAGLGPHLRVVAGPWPQVQDLFPRCSWNLQDLRGRAELEAWLLWVHQGAGPALPDPAPAMCQQRRWAALLGVFWPGLTFQSWLFSVA